MSVNAVFFTNLHIFNFIESIFFSFDFFFFNFLALFYLCFLYFVLSKCFRIQFIDPKERLTTKM